MNAVFFTLFSPFNNVICYFPHDASGTLRKLERSLNNLHDLYKAMNSPPKSKSTVLLHAWTLKPAHGS